ncbi:MAG: T9SS type A sorting domain-containing protein [candidate division Zixibacteria bacterium]|nr:T9SS type A sorting domain-containing protein [candidate division Zixibacteria bacterium]
MRGLKLFIGTALSLALILFLVPITANAHSSAYPQQPYLSPAGETSSGAGDSETPSESDAQAKTNAEGVLIPPDTPLPESGSDRQLLATDPNCPPNQPPYFDPFTDVDTMALCLGETISDTIIAVDPNTDQTLTLTMITGPGSFSSTPSLSPVTGYYEFLPTSAGSFAVTFQVHDDAGDTTRAMKTYVVFVNEPPQVISGDTTMFKCWTGQVLSYDIVAEDAEGDVIEFSLLSSYGGIDPQTGELAFVADSSGVYCFDIVAADICGADTASICVTVQTNTMPFINGFTDKYIRCRPPETICFDVTAGDLEGDSLVITMIEGPGMFSQTSNTQGQTCFMPADVDSADYMFIYEVTDPCRRDEYDKCTACPPVPRDTVIITVILQDGVELSCPNDTILFLCAPETVCVPVGGIPQDATITVTPSTAWYDVQAGTVCFEADATMSELFTIIVANECGRDSCQFLANVTMNAPPVVTAEDSTVFLCELTDICFPITVSDIDMNVVDTSLIGNGTLSGRYVCFTPTEAGEYEFIISAVDACNAEAADTVVITVVENTPPTLAVPDDFTELLCEPEEICFPIEIGDAEGNIQIVSVNPSGYFDAINSTICFTPQGTGEYRFEITITDSCYTSAVDTVAVTVAFGETAAIDCPGDPIYSDMCGSGQICYPLAITPFDAAVDITNQLITASYINGEVCFHADTSGTYVFDVTAEAECGTDNCQLTFVVTIGETLDLVCPGDTSVFICEPDTLCFDVEGVPQTATVTVSPPSAWYNAENGTVCFYTNCSVEKDLKVVAEGECSIDSCMFTVDVTMNSRPLVIMQPDTLVELCDPEWIAVSVAVSDIDYNIDTIIVTNGGTYSAFLGRVFYHVEGPGVYPVLVRAIDECGAYHTDTTLVTVVMNTPPVVDAGPDQDLMLCELTEVCFDVEITDNNLARVIVLPTGTYNAQTGQVCFTPSDTGNFLFIVEAFDLCNEMSADTVNIHISLNAIPVVVSAPDKAVTICEPTEICFPVSIDDSDDNIETITVSMNGVYESDTVCFLAEAAGIYQLITTATDYCGEVAADTTVVTVIMNTPPTVTMADDFEVFQCDFEEICVPVTVDDVDDNLEVVMPNIGGYYPQDGKICFTPDSVGVYTITLAAVDTCGEMSADTTLVTVTTGPAAEIVCPIDPFNVFTCESFQYCIPLEVTPAEAQVTTSYGTYANGQLCVNIDTAGWYAIEVIADGPCGSDTCTVEVEAVFGETPELTCPADTAVFLCGPADICRPLAVDPASATVTISPIGVYNEGAVCFTADTAGHYVLTAIAEDACGADTCALIVDVTFNSAPTVIAGPDTSYFQCVYEEICRPVTIGDVDHNIDSVRVTPLGSYHENDSTVCFTPPGEGTYCLVVTAYDACEETAADTVCITVTTGVYATIDCPEPTERHLCTAETICVPLTIEPATATVTVSYGSYDDGQLCFLADTAGTYAVRVIATESCGADTCDVVVNMVFDDEADIVCPELPVTSTLCGPDSISVPLVITPGTATVTVSPVGRYDFARHVIRLYADTSGTYELTVIADAPCGSDTCVVTVDVLIIGVPKVTCPGDFDTLVCLPEISEICFPVTIEGEEYTVAVQPNGEFSGNMACIPIDGPGVYATRVIATSICGADTCEFELTIIENHAPVLTVPDEVLIPWCDGDEGEICIDGIFASDFEGDALTFTQTCGVGTFNLMTADSGVLCFEPGAHDTTYHFCISVDDGCQTVEDTFQVTLYPSAVCSLCVVASIETDSCFNVGTRVPVYVKAQTNDEIAGFDLLLSYDPATLTFYSAVPGEPIDGWEYFTYRIGENACMGCSEGSIHLVGIADINNGGNHPPQEQLLPQGTLVKLIMQISNDQTLGGMYLPIGFQWMKCSDNSFSDPDGNNLYVDLRIYNSFGYMEWDEYDEVHFPESERPYGVGAPDSCLVGDKITPIRCVEFYDGGVCVKHPDSIDARGDVNLNGIAYEIADAVVFTNYFVYGYAAFVVSVPGQIAASDVNADGYALSIADLVYLIRVIIGDAQPYPKIVPSDALVGVNAACSNGTMDVQISSHYDIGACWLVFEYDGVQPLTPEALQFPSGMEMKYAISDNAVKVLVYGGMEKDVKFLPGSHDLISIPFTGDGELRLVHSEFATYAGMALNSTSGGSVLPVDFGVSQNYPNPFNPSTSFDLTLPSAGSWQITIINVAGQEVHRLCGEAGPGTVTTSWNGCDDQGRPVASGVYLYKVEFGDQVQTKKMIMLK